MVEGVGDIRRTLKLCFLSSPGDHGNNTQPGLQTEPVPYDGNEGFSPWCADLQESRAGCVGVDTCCVCV